MLWLKNKLCRTSQLSARVILSDTNVGNTNKNQDIPTSVPYNCRE